LRPKCPQRSAALDGLRAVAALSVLVFHVWLYRPGPPPGPRDALADKLAFESCRGLILFFVLSGYLLYGAFLRGPVDWRRYAKRRIARIVPAYYVCILGCLALYGAAGYSDIVPPLDQLPLFAVFAQNYSQATVMQVDPVTWTLAVEASFYVLLPFAGLLALRLRGRAHYAALLALVGLTVGWNALTAGFLASKALPAYAGHFALGMIVAVWAAGRHERPPLSARRTAGLMLGGAALIALNGYWHETTAPDAFVRGGLGDLTAGAGFALVVAGTVAGTGPSVAWLRARPLAAVGVASFGIYLWHVPLLLVARELGAAPAAFLPRLGLAAAAAIAAGALSWRLVERPSLRAAAPTAARRRPSGSARRSPALLRRSGGATPHPRSAH
jgi:peptidoglycan/LPS O-acetylase OafA/YrhL